MRGITSPMIRPGRAPIIGERTASPVLLTTSSACSFPRLCNRAPYSAALHVLTTLCFRNIGTWWPEQPKPSLREVKGNGGVATVAASHAELGDYFLQCEGGPRLLFTENETNNERVFGTPNTSPYVKDGIDNHIVTGRQETVNPNLTGTKPAAPYHPDLPPRIPSPTLHPL